MLIFAKNQNKKNKFYAKNDQIFYSLLILLTSASSIRLNLL